MTTEETTMMHGVLTLKMAIKIHRHVFLDPDAHCSFITASAAKRQGPREPFSFGVIYGPDPRTTTERVAFTVSTRDGDLKFQVKRAYTLPTLQTAKQRCDWPVMKQRWNHLADLDLPLIDSSRMTVLDGEVIRGVHDVLEQRIP